ncbi:hypothetical protein ABIA32_000989 [Streptacidiphilus sp. MAP12-20]|uniref:hypothetical protein n=1 Tax=Streptacidiphilus sp. MAP12-20 TaxID=3156299 RepID=UPI003514971F
MSATPRHRSQQAEREELAGLLPAAAAPELSRGRHLLLKEHLMSTVTENSQRTAKRRTLTLRLALPVGLAAAVAGVALTAGAGHPAAPTPGLAAGSQSPVSIGDVAYTVQSSGDDTVRLTVLDPNKPVDVPRLQRDLDRLGVRSHVYAGEPGCQAPAPKSPPVDSSDAALNAMNGDSRTRLAYFGWDISSEGVKQVLTVHPSRIPTGEQIFIYLPLARTSPANGFRELEAALMTNPAPSCMPARTYTNPLANLSRSATPTPTPAH